MHCYWLAAILLSIGFCHGQTIHPNAHAHNDYEHTRPLLDALQNGFRSVEADIHLIDGQLYVAHNRPRASEYRTLQALYLDPLDSLWKLHPEFYSANSVMLLLVDIKTNATATLPKLLNVLRQYPGLFLPDSPQHFVRVVISGNRDYGMILDSKDLSIDGRPNDLGKGYSSDRMPLISDHYGKWMDWSGRGTPDAADLQELRTLARLVHAENKKLRLWAIPDNEMVWGVLLEVGVDLINTDNLIGLNEYLTRRKATGRQ
jgi:hypothetical protein